MVIRTCSCVCICVFVYLSICSCVCGGDEIQVQRPIPRERTFHSSAIERVIAEVAPNLRDEELAILFTNCFPNALDTTVYAFQTHGEDAFLVTGDIKAMWLRDSTNQVLPYLPYTPEDPHLSNLIKGLIRRQARSVLLDPYANAFNYNASSEGWQDDIRTPSMTPEVFEGKYELDSLAAFMKLSYYYWYYTRDISVFDATWLQALNTSVSVIWVQMTSMQEQLPNPPYLFQRETTRASDTLIQDGVGVPGARIGLSRSFFRPSDDATTFPFHIPANAMVSVELQHISELLHELNADKILGADALAELCQTLGKGIEDAVWALAEQRTMFPYEVDGYASSYFMDDANLPSLLSLPYLGFTSVHDPLYLRTRDYVLSPKNPFRFSGEVATGIGSPHTGPQFVWPMSVMMRALTSSNISEISECLNVIKASSAGTGFMHESFHVNNVYDFTRAWFAWANSLLGELVLKLVHEYPDEMLKDGACVKSLRPGVSLAHKHTYVPTHM